MLFRSSYEGVNVPVEEGFPKGYVIRLDAKGSGTTDIAGETYRITWKEDNGALTITDEEVGVLTGTVSGGVMVLNIEGTLVTLTK